AVVDAQKNSWTTGEKALIFVRRVRSVGEIERRLLRAHDDWICDRLETELVSTRRASASAWRSVRRDYERSLAMGSPSSADEDPVSAAAQHSLSVRFTEPQAETFRASQRRPVLAWLGARTLWTEIRRDVVLTRRLAIRRAPPASVDEAREDEQRRVLLGRAVR